MAKKEEKHIRHFFVDEAGDLTLFDKKGRIIIGNEGVSKFFMVGFAEVENAELAKKLLEDLRKELLTDPYFKDVPSMQKDRKKTAIVFHAKDDLPEVRREVFKVLNRLNIKVHIVIRRKNRLAEDAKYMFETFKKKVNENDIYDDLVKRIFRNSLHKAEENIVYFARRGKSDRNIALEGAIDKAKRNFQAKYHLESNKLVNIISAHPHEYIGLQIVDYYLWALQRLYERKEDRFFNLLSKDYRVIMDIDDKRNNDYGEWYTDKNKLELIKIMLG